MRIIELGRCVNNTDPMGLGRIRVEFLDKLNSSIERSVVSYEEWDENDPFLFYPFLPAHLNIVPQQNQLVKLVFWNVNNNSLNKEYVAGPFVNTFDFSGQGIDRQLQSTSRGVRIKKEPNIYRPENGQLIDAATKGSVTKPEDVALNGHYGSDVILRRNGIVLRAGKLDDEKVRQSGRPMAFQKPGRLQLKKYDYTVELTHKEVLSEERQDKGLNTVVEYDVFDIGANAPQYTATLSCYKIINNRPPYDTYSFDQNQTVPDTNKALLYTVGFTGSTLQEIGRDLAQELRFIDMTLYQTELNPQFYKVETHPFYYKPTQRFFEALSSTTANQNAKLLYDNLQFNSSKAFGLSYSTVEKQVPVQAVKKTIPVQNKTAAPTTMAALMSDVFYTLSYEANVPNDGDKINFAGLDNYELTQEQILEEVHNKTFSQVRGEPLITLLRLMVEWMLSHKHNPAETGIAPPGLTESLSKELQAAEEKLVNQKIRIN